MTEKHAKAAGMDATGRPMTISGTPMMVFVLLRLTAYLFFPGSSERASWTAVKP